MLYIKFVNARRDGAMPGIWALASLDVRGTRGGAQSRQLPGVLIFDALVHVLYKGETGD